MISTKINKQEFNPYYTTYIDNSTDIDILKGLKKNLMGNIDFYTNLPHEKHDYAYASGKWTVKQVILHIIDTERIFTYRALRIARNDTTPLAGFDQDDYVNNSDITNRSLESLIKEYTTVREASISLYESFGKEDLIKIGMASNSPISVRAIGYILTGHENHHNKIIKERYL